MINMAFLPKSHCGIIILKLNGKAIKGTADQRVGIGALAEFN